MSAGKLTPATSHRELADRLLEWKAPTGRRLKPGATFKHRRRSGTWRFVAYVDHPTAPHVEAVKVGGRTTKGRANVRALTPDGVYNVSAAKADR